MLPSEHGNKQCQEVPKGFKQFQAVAYVDPVTNVLHSAVGLDVCGSQICNVVVWV